MAGVAKTPRFQRGDNKTVERVQGGRFARGNAVAAGPHKNRPKPDKRYLAHRLKPFSTPRTPGKVDKRTKEGAVLKKTREDLIAHCGGPDAVSVVQRELIERAAWLRVQLFLLDARMADGEPFGEFRANMYISWSNCLTRLLSRLGLEAKPPPSRSLEHYLSEMAAE